MISVSSFISPSPTHLTSEDLGEKSRQRPSGNRAWREGGGGGRERREGEEGGREGRREGEEGGREGGRERGRKGEREEVREGGRTHANITAQILLSLSAATCAAPFTCYSPLFPCTTTHSHCPSTCTPPPYSPPALTWLRSASGSSSATSILENSVPWSGLILITLRRRKM